MNLYETVFIARQDLSATQVEGLANRFADVVRDNGGQVGKIEHVGLQNLAYPIKKNRKGHYVLMNVTASSAALDEMSRLLGLSEDILRFLNVKVDLHENGPSALLKAFRFDREDGEGREGRDGRDRDGRERRPYTPRGDRHGQGDAPVAQAAE